MITANDFMNIINDSHFYNLKKMKNKYGNINIEEVIKILKSTFYKYISICDFKNNDSAYAPSLININDNVYKVLISGNDSKNYSIEKMENEIHSTLKIENIHSDRNSILNILKVATPKNNDENKICMCPTKKILTPALGLCIKNCLSMPNFPGISKTIA